MFNKFSLFRNLDIVGEVLTEAKQLLNEQRKTIERQQEEIDNLQQQISRLNEQTGETEKKVDPFKVYPTPYVFEHNPSTICPRCDMSWEGTMGYSCSDSLCPFNQIHLR
jgi:ArsR family metal-binding transcriptional regulator